jgi:hypothetical protein
MDSNASKHFTALAVQRSNSHDCSTITVSEVHFSFKSTLPMYC